MRTIVPGSPENVVNTHHYQAMYYPDGSYAGINELVFNFKAMARLVFERNRATFGRRQDGYDA